MLLTATALASISPFVGSTLASYFAQKTLDAYFDTEAKLADELREVIDATILEYQDKHPFNTGRLLPFYHSPELISELLKFRVMKPEEYSIEDLSVALKKEVGMAQPTEEQLSDFYEIFINHINSNANLKKLEIKETFQEEIFNISKSITTLSQEVSLLAQIYNGELETEWKDRLNAYVDTIKQFKPVTALGLLEKFEENINRSSKKPSNEFMAFLAFQKGRCYGLTDRISDAYKCYIKAHDLDNGSLLFAEWAAIAYHQLKEIDEAKNISDTIIEKERYNATAWAIRVLTEPIEDFNINLEAAPKVVKENLTFIRLLEQLNEGSSDHIKLLYENGLIPNCISYKSTEITIDNFKEGLFWVNVCLREIFRYFYFDFMHVSEAQKDEMTVLNQLLGQILKVIKASEIKTDELLLDFLYALTNFYLTQDSKSALEMEVCYRKLKNQDVIYGIHCANCLQLAGHLDRAISFIEEFDFNNSEYLLLKLYCYNKANENEKYIAAVKSFVSSITEFKSEFLLMYINQIIELKLTGRLSAFTKEEFLLNKNFTEANDEIVVRNITEILFDSANEGNLSALMQVIDSSEDKQLINLIGSAFFAAGEDESAIKVLGKHLDATDPQRELYQYINALYRSKKSHTELLVLLKKWRTEYDFNRQLLYFEAELRRNLMEWAEIIAICEYYLSSYQDDEVMLTLYIHALNEINTDESRAKIQSKSLELQDFDFKDPHNVGFISDTLFTHAKELEAFELLYRYAKDPKQVSLRMTYFNLCLRKSRIDFSNPPLIAYEIADEGKWVKYKLNNEVRFVELNEEAKAHPNYSQFFGKKIGETIVIKRVFGNITDTITIIRVMDKFLSLHDEIMEQASDPLAGLPMQSFQFDPNNPSSFFDLLKSISGDEHTIQLNQEAENLSAYYSGAFSLSEIAYTKYKNVIRDAYYNLILQEKGIYTLPLSAYGSPISSKNTFILDHSSLIFLFQLRHVHNITFPHKFIISKYIYENLKAILRQIEQGINPLYGVGFAEDGQVEFDNLENFHKGQLNHFRGLIDFIAENCIVQLSDRTVDFIRNANLQVGENHMLDAALSTILLVEDIEESILVTDDLKYLRFNILPIIHQCSTEYYVKHFFGKESPVLNEFIKNKFINYSPEAWQLNEEFIMHLGGQNSSYNLLLQNMSIRNGMQNLDSALAHMKEIVLNQIISEESMSLYIRDILVNLLRDVGKKALYLIGSRIENDFKLLGNKLNLVLKSLDDALNIILYSSR